MKFKTIALSIVLGTVISILSACGVDEEIVGTWEDEMLGAVTFEFKDNGDVIIDSLDEVVEGTFSTSGDKIKIKAGDQKQSFTYSVSGDKLYLSSSQGRIGYDRVEEN
jgi:hypothetical protein